MRLYLWIIFIWNPIFGRSKRKRSRTVFEGSGDEDRNYVLKNNGLTLFNYPADSILIKPQISAREINTTQKPHSRANSITPNVSPEITRLFETDAYDNLPEPEILSTTNVAKSTRRYVAKMLCKDFCLISRFFFF